MSAPAFHSSDEVKAALAAVDVLDVVRSAFIDHHLGRTLLPAEACLYWKAPDGGLARSIAMQAHLDGPQPRAGLKLINAAVNNPDRGMTRAEGLVALFDPMTGRITNLLPAGDISSIRTAAVSTLAAQQLARRPAKALAVLGAGVLAQTHVQLLLKARLGIEEVRVYDRDPARASKLAIPADEPPASLKVAASAREAIHDADVVVTATTATEPYIEFDWLKPGSLVVNVSLDDLHSEVFLRADALYLDDWQIVSADTRRQLGKLCRAGAVVQASSEAAGNGARALTGELGALFAGASAGRGSDEEIIVVNPFGLAISDIALAAAVVEVLADAR